MRRAGFVGSAARRQKTVLCALLGLAVVALLGAQEGGAQAQQALGSSIDQTLKTPQTVTPDQLRQMLGEGSGAWSDETMPPQTTILEPTATSNPSLPLSRLEQILSQRAGVRLTQFGYDQMGIGRAVMLPQMGGVQDDYILGPGDEIVVTLRGQENSEQRVLVDREGNVILPRISPVGATGLAFAAFRAQLLAAIHNAYVATDAYVSVGRLRQISVMVAGEVGSPGVRTLTALSTPIDALLVSGGIKKTGSLRAVKLIHAGKTVTIDLYAFQTAGIQPRQVALGDGDRIVVPPLKKIVAAAGWLRRPGIYEIADGKSAMSVRDLSALAGGLEVRGRYRLAVLHLEPDGQIRLVPVTSGSDLVRDGEILMALPSADQVVDRATLAGGTVLAGGYPIRGGTQLSQILKESGALGASPYTLFGILSRRDPRTSLRSLIAFSPVAVLFGADDPTLISGDIVRVFSLRESRLLSRSLGIYAAQKRLEDQEKRNPNLEAAAAPVTPSRTSGQQAGATPSRSSAAQSNNTGAQSVFVALSSGADASAPLDESREFEEFEATDLANQADSYGPCKHFDPKAAAGPAQQPSAQNLEEPVPNARVTPLNTEVCSLRQLAEQLDVDVIVLLDFLQDHAVTLDGAVRGPGSYIIGPGVNLHDLVTVAGGTADWVDGSGVELTTTDVDPTTGSATVLRKTLPLTEATLAHYGVRPGDALRFREVYTDIEAGSVMLEGEVRFPGEYRILRGEHLLDLLKRAGGLTDIAYPYGALYLRKSVAALEEEQYRRSADQLENALLAAVAHTTTTTRAESGLFASAQTLVETLRTQKGLGRISVVADPTVLSAKPAENPLLEPGDVIYIPQRPNTVSVLGEVLQPGSFSYDKRLTAANYLAKAGGFSGFADDALTFIILPNGMAEKYETSWLASGGQSVPPGSVIVVPRDIAPFSWQDFLINSSQIFSQLAIAGASLAVLSTKLN